MTKPTCSLASSSHLQFHEKHKSNSFFALFIHEIKDLLPRFSSLMNVSIAVESIVSPYMCFYINEAAIINVSINSFCCLMASKCFTADILQLVRKDLVSQCNHLNIDKQAI